MISLLLAFQTQVSLEQLRNYKYDCPSPIISRIDNTTLGIGTNWSSQTPCKNLLGNSISLGATLKNVTPILNRHDVVYIYSYLNVIEVSVLIPANFLCTGCRLVGSMAPAFPVTSLPLGIWAIENTGFFAPKEIFSIDSAALPLRGLKVFSEEKSRVRTPPASSLVSCDPGDIAFDESFYYRCTHFPGLYLKDQVIYRWFRIPLQLGW